MNEAFSRIAMWTAHQAGRASAFALAVLVVLAWAITGPLFHFSDTWQLVINTGTTIVTFLMVFLIQCTQNRDTEAIQIKLDELIRCTKAARDMLIDVEDAPEGTLEQRKKEFAELKERKGGDQQPARTTGSPRKRNGKRSPPTGADRRN